MSSLSHEKDHCCSVKVIQSGRKIKETSLRHLEIETTVRWKMFLKMLGMHMFFFLLPAAVGQLAFVIGWFLLIFYTKDLVKVSYSWLHWCACRSRVFPYYWLIWSMPWKHEWNPTRTLPNTHAACCQLRFLARRFVWVDSVDSGSKKTAISAFWHRLPLWWDTHHNKLPIHRVNDPNHLGYLHSITFCQYIFLSEHLLCGAWAARAGSTIWTSSAGGGGGGCKPICVNHSVCSFGPRKWAQHMLILGFYGLKWKVESWMGT